MEIWISFTFGDSNVKVRKNKKQIYSEKFLNPFLLSPKARIWEAF